MFDALADRLEDAWKKLRGQDKISSANIQETLKEVRRALLEADVNLQVVKGFIAEVEKQALGAGSYFWSQSRPAIYQNCL